MYKIILASNSPRRKELLAGLDLDFEVHVLKDIDESYPDDLPASEVAAYISHKKAAAYKNIIAEDQLVITADTVVVLGDQILGKPATREEAVDTSCHHRCVPDHHGGAAVSFCHVGGDLQGALG